jgi:hypothetical protein
LGPWQRRGLQREIPAWHAVFARIALAEGQQDPKWHIDRITLDRAVRELELILEAHDVAARPR